MLLLRHTARVEYRGFGGAIVGIEIAGFRIATGPARRFKVVEKEPVGLYQATDGVAFVVWPADIVTLTADDGVVARRDNVPCFSGSEKFAKASPRCRRHTGLLPFHSRNLDKRRRE